MKANFYEKLMSIGQYSGCHQMVERSFYIKGRKFPICARCMGVVIGNIAAYSLFLIYTLPLKFCFIGCMIMFLDWFVQYIGLCKSTNIRRLITGIMGGYALTTAHCTAIKYVVQQFF